VFEIASGGQLEPVKQFGVTPAHPSKHLASMAKDDLDVRQYGRA
jgi:hypothetical protein